MEVWNTVLAENGMEINIKNATNYNNKRRKIRRKHRNLWNKNRTS